MVTSSLQKNYDSFAPYYDTVVGHRHEEAVFLRRILSACAPHAATLLELGCGTGSMLKVLCRYYNATGIDRSRAMLARAKRKAPKAKLIQGDITSFGVKERFDAIICPFDTMNHLTSLTAWRKVFLNVYRHLNPAGIFVFDVNTEAKMKCYSDDPTVLLSDAYTTIVDVKKTARYRYRVSHKVFEHQRGNRFILHEMQIPEYIPPTKTILSELKPFFRRVVVIDPDRSRPSHHSHELFFVCQGPRDGRKVS